MSTAYASSSISSSFIVLQDMESTPVYTVVVVLVVQRVL